MMNTLATQKSQISFLEWGKRDPAKAVILLHGFPQSAETWECVAKNLAGEGYWVIAPRQRGYSCELSPKGFWHYSVAKLVGDVQQLTRQLGISEFHLVGHDWGGVIGWAYCCLHPNQLRTFTSVSTPHPRAILLGSFKSLQPLKLWYFPVLMLPGLAYTALRFRHGKVVSLILRRMGLPTEWCERYVAWLGEPGRIAGALNWYRALPLDAWLLQHRSISNVKTLYIWGDHDVTVDRKSAELTASFVKGEYSFFPLKGVSHWVPETEPDELGRLLFDWFRLS